MTKTSYGILMYNDDENTENFAGIKIRNGFIVFVLNINGRFNKLVSRNPIDSTKTWHKLRIIRERKRFRMIVDSDMVVLSNDIFDESKFSLSGPLLIGGLSENSKTNHKFHMTRGLNGAIQRVNNFLVFVSLKTNYNI